MADFNWDDYDLDFGGATFGPASAYPGFWNPNAPALNANGNYVPRDANVYDQSGQPVYTGSIGEGQQKRYDPQTGRWVDDGPANSALYATQNAGGMGGPADQAKLAAFREAGRQAGIRVDEGDANVLNDPRFQSWQPGQAMPWGASGTGSSIGGVGGAPQSIQPFTERFAAPTMEDAQNSPGYQFRLGEGLKALERRSAASGIANLPGTMKALQNYAQDSASQEYGNVYDRALGEYDRRFGVHQWNEGNRYGSERSNRMDDFGIYDSNRAFAEGQRLNDFNIWNTQDMNQWNRTATLADMGLRAAALGASSGQNFANSAQDLLTGQGDVSASSRIAGSNAISNGVNTVANNTMTLEQLRRRGVR